MHIRFCCPWLHVLVYRISGFRDLDASQEASLMCLPKARVDVKVAKKRNSAPRSPVVSQCKEEAAACRSQDAYLSIYLYIYIYR